MPKSSVQHAPLNEIAQLFMGLFATARPDESSVSEPIPMLSVRWLSNPEEPLPAMYVSRNNPDRIDRYRVQPGDVLVSSRSTTLRVGVVPPDIHSVPINSTLLGVRCSPDLLPELLAAYLRHPAGAAHLSAASQSGTVQMNLTASTLGNIPVPVLPIDEQHELARLLASADAAHDHAVAAAELRRQVAHDIVIASMTGRNLAHA